MSRKKKIMNKPKTHCVVILDKSGSMDGYKKPRTISDFNEKIQMYQEVDKEGEQEVLGYFISFNTHLDEHVWCKPANELTQIDDTIYKPVGGTSLQDAIVHVLKKLKEQVVLGEKDAVLVSIITDGDENSSVTYGGPAGAHEVKKTIEELQATGKWTITYIGANQNVSEVANRYGLIRANCAVYSDETAQSTGDAYHYSNVRSMSYFDARKVGMTASVNLMSDTDEVADLTDLKEIK